MMLPHSSNRKSFVIDIFSLPGNDLGLNIVSDARRCRLADASLRFENIGLELIEK